MVRLCKTNIWWKSKIVLYGYSFIVYIKTDHIYKDITEDVETRFDTSNYDLDYQKEKNKKAIGLTAKTYSYLIVNGSNDEKAKGTKSVS